MVDAAGAAAMFLWGFATWWLLLAVCSISATIRHGIPFNLGWWGLVFPLGVYTGSTIKLGLVVHSMVFTVLGAIAVGVHVVVTLIVSYLTARKAWSGQLFHAPCLTPSTATAAASAAASATDCRAGETAVAKAFDDVTAAALKLEQQLTRDISAHGGNQHVGCSESGAATVADPAAAAEVQTGPTSTGSKSSFVGDLEQGSNQRLAQGQLPAHWHCDAVAAGRGCASMDPMQ
eukprot:GHUV01012684.1.p2 GENE.GHUV01012684.1~~GHUV01012684.1.p2  ORF type:complete len:232 (+),score=16.24 GHUV01012684.1:2542-3237(+)